MSSSDKPTKPHYKEVDGFILPGLFSEDHFRSALAYKPRADDLFIVTYPKCGTTWVQNIVGCILRKGKTFHSGLDFMTHAPFLEMRGADAVVSMKRPGAIKMHLPFHMTPWSPDAKYIFVARNPKDTCVSFYHHTESKPFYKFKGGDFEVFFELFMEGQVDFGDYFDTTLSWYERRDEPNVLFLTYEELKRDTRANVLRIAGFIDPKYKEEMEEDGEYLQNVIHHSSFGFMSQHLEKSMEALKKTPIDQLLSDSQVPKDIKAFYSNIASLQESTENSKSTFLRKGVVGDWRSYFSLEQNERMSRKIHEKMARTGLPEIWKDDI